MSKIVLLLFLFCPQKIWAFGFLGNLISDEDVSTKIDYSGEYAESKFIKDFSSHIDTYSSKFNLFTPVFQNEKESMGFSTDVESTRVYGQDFSSPASLLRNNFYSYGVGSFYRKKLNNNRIFATYINFSSASDRPFKNPYDNNFQVFGVYKVQNNDISDWVYLLAYASNRSLLSGIPLPGVAYLWRPGGPFFGIFGLPMNYIFMMPMPNLFISATAVVPITFKLDVSYRFWGPVVAFTNLNMDHSHYFISDRPNKEDRIYFDHKSIEGGAKFLLDRKSNVSFGVAYNFYDSIYQAKSYFSDRSWSVDLDDRWIWKLKITLTL